MSAWAWNRKYTNYYVPSEKVENPEFGNRLQAVIDNPASSANDKSFCSSMLEFFKKSNSLTTKQFACLERMESNLNPSVAQARQDWINSWDDEKRNIAKMCAEYYIQTGYFTDLAKKIIGDANFVPTEKQYRAMCENNYAKRLVKNMTSHAFNVGDIAQLRGRNNAGEGVVTIVKISDAITRQSSNIGGRLYHVMWLSSGEEGAVLEKELKSYRAK